MKLTVKDLFIGLEFKIEREVDLPHQPPLIHIAHESRKSDYEGIYLYPNIVKIPSSSS
ncbi:hypothetical protein SRABI27_00855 [Pedobacter sp. Bi27]|nr:hypothetical protein SRABI126_00857 [Pedobacter sp. Bi126]CAH0164550.1 hypothetical protein SRABI27_00855 [Pedobacter sp. Bi27]CAH0282864.1 hypothetical protein SRABI36_04069 [Pedobacter sp. Bi36]